MKKSILTISSAALLAATLIGCGGETPAPAAPAESTFGCKQENVPAPKWTCVPMFEGSYAGVGVAPKSAAGMGFMRTKALAEGRQDLAQQIKVNVKSKVKSFTQTTGVGSSETVDTLTAAATNQVAKVDLSSSKQVDAWVAPSGTLYMLVAVPEGKVNAAVKDAVKSSLKNDNAMWQQFQAKKALDELEAEFPTD